MPVIALFVLSLLWGSTFYFTKMVLPDFHPVSIVFYRCLLGGLTLLPFFLWKRKKQDFQNVLPLIGITLLSTGIPWVFMSFSQKGLDTTISAVLNATGPIWGVIFSFFILKIPLRKKEIFSVLIGFTGILVAFFLGTSNKINFTFSSAVLLLIAVSLYALSAIFTSKYLRNVTVYTISFVSLLTGSIYSGLFMIFIEPSSYQAFMDIKNVGALMMLGVFNSGIGNLLYFYLVQKAGPIFALLITYLMPITTILLGVLLLNENLVAGTVFALIFVLISVYFSRERRRK
ncbi:MULTISPECIES: DMT family transporter [unclassified Virgibacillus]|uniref:DMT family transporter n=1 Tax=unclassified Virgibacillus TaxID=2620237 RepID=UPI0009099C23|nr:MULTISPECIES: DMT family transporter [unclassified Virgibacillus]API93213.1 hypothetical protein BKP57_16185 [Virgibacillus sp. 6R]MBS7428742.1 DMT family transporter [Virgibacillus sp. 19R1-5]